MRGGGRLHPGVFRAKKCGVVELNVQVDHVYLIISSCLSRCLWNCLRVASDQFRCTDSDLKTSCIP